MLGVTRWGDARSVITPRDVNKTLSPSSSVRGWDSFTCLGVGKNNVALSTATVCNHDDVNAYLRPVTIVFDLMGGQLVRNIGPEEKNIGTFLGFYQQVSKAQP